MSTHLLDLKKNLLFRGTNLLTWLSVVTSRFRSARKLLEVEGVIAQVFQGLLALCTVSSALIKAGLNHQLWYKQATSNTLI